MEKHEISKLADVLYEKFNSMNILELYNLNKAVEKAFGMTAAPVQIPGKEEVKVEERTEFNVVLKDFGAKKISVIKTVRASLGLGLKEAKTLVEGVPATLKEGISKEEAEELKKVLEDVGAVLEIV